MQPRCCSSAVLHDSFSTGAVVTLPPLWRSSTTPKCTVFLKGVENLSVLTSVPVLVSHKKIVIWSEFMAKHVLERDDV